MIYQFGILRTYPYGPSEEERLKREAAQARNAPWLGSDTLGIEVSEPALAAACGLGNIDPQHGKNANPDLAAIEVATHWPLPGDGAKLVTIRLDLDALGAMAVLLMRQDIEDLAAFPEIRTRIEIIAKADRFDNGPWPGPRPLPQSAAQWRTAFRLDTPLPALNAMIHERALSLEDKVAFLESWLKSGAWPGRADYEAKARQFVDELREATRRGEIKSELRYGGALAVVRATHPAALTQIGYRLAPVVLACNPSFVFADGTTGVKYTLAQWRSGYIDLDAIADELGRLENGWGGQLNIKGSPQAQASLLTFSDLFAVIERHIGVIKHQQRSNVVNGGQS